MSEIVYTVALIGGPKDKTSIKVYESAINRPVIFPALNAVYRPEGWNPEMRVGVFRYSPEDGWP